MATNYPSGLDSLSNPAGSDALSTGHAAQHANANDAIEAIEGELGLDPAGGSATVKARFDTIEANDWVTTARIADSQVTSAKILDATITGSDIASGTVTSTNLLDGTIVNADVNAAAAIDKTKIAGTAVTVADTGTVTSTMLLDGTIVNADVNAAAAIVKTKISGTAVTLADSGTVTSTMIADATITGSDIASGTVTTANILDGTIVDADISATAAISASKITGLSAAGTIGNLLTTNQATCAADWTAVSSTLAYTGGVTTATLTTVNASTGASANIPVGSIVAGQTYNFRVTVDASSTRNVAILYRFYAGATPLGAGAVAGNAITAGVGGISRAVAVAPATADNAYVYVLAYSTGSISDTVSFSQAGVWQGAGGMWAPPGTPIANLGTYADETVGRRVFTWDTVNSRWQQTFGSTGRRSITSWDAAGTITGTALPTGWGPVSGQAGYYDIRRDGNRVTVHISQLQATSTNPTPLAIPSGFAPVIGSQFLAPMVPGTGAQVSRTWQNAGGLGRGASTLFTANDIALLLEFTWIGPDAWPTALPGTAVGTIPA